MFCFSHYKFVEAFKDQAGRVLKTDEIEKMMSPRFIVNKGSVRPKAHSDKGEASACKCANTNDRIFDRIKQGLYKVR